MTLFEIFLSKTPVSIHWEEPVDYGQRQASFKIGNRRYIFFASLAEEEQTLGFNPIDGQHSIPERWVISFKAEDASQYDMTGDHQSFVLFTTLCDCFRRLIKVNSKIRCLEIQPSDFKRASVYQKIIRKALPTWKIDDEYYDESGVIIAYEQQK